MGGVNVDAGRNQEATVWVGGLEPQVNEELLFELFLNAGPVTSVVMPKDKITGTHQNFAFVEFEGVEDAEYAIRLFNNLKVYGKPIKVNRVSSRHHSRAIVLLHVSFRHGLQHLNAVMFPACC